LEMDGLLQLLVGVVAHLVAADAKRLGIRDLQGPVEAAPEQDAADPPGDKHENTAQAVVRPPQDIPAAPHKTFRRGLLIAHMSLMPFRPRGAARAQTSLRFDIPLRRNDVTVNALPICGARSVVA